MIEKGYQICKNCGSDIKYKNKRQHWAHISSKTWRCLSNSIAEPYLGKN